jgi:ribosomal protein L31
MPYLFYCDLCEQLIKEGDTKYLLSVRKLVQRDDTEENYNQEEFGQIGANDIYKFIKNIKKETVTIEICSKCHAIFEKFVKLRLKELKKIQKQLKPYEEDEVDGNV